MKVVYTCESCGEREVRDFFLTELDMSTGRIQRPCSCGGVIRRTHVHVKELD